MPPPTETHPFLTCPYFPPHTPQRFSRIKPLKNHQGAESTLWASPGRRQDHGSLCSGSSTAAGQHPGQQGITHSLQQGSIQGSMAASRAAWQHHSLTAAGQHQCSTAQHWLHTAAGLSGFVVPQALGVFGAPGTRGAAQKAEGQRSATTVHSNHIQSNLHRALWLGGHNKAECGLHTVSSNRSSCVPPCCYSMSWTGSILSCPCGTAALVTASEGAVDGEKLKCRGISPHLGWSHYYNCKTRAESFFSEFHVPLVTEPHLVPRRLNLENTKAAKALCSEPFHADTRGSSWAGQVIEPHHFFFSFPKQIISKLKFFRLQRKPARLFTTYSRNPAQGKSAAEQMQAELRWFLSLDGTYLSLAGDTSKLLPW